MSESVRLTDVELRGVEDVVILSVVAYKLGGQFEDVGHCILYYIQCTGVWYIVNGIL